MWPTIAYQNKKALYDIFRRGLDAGDRARYPTKPAKS